MSNKIEFIIIEDTPVCYINLTGAAIHGILASIKLSHIKDTYMDYQFKIPRKCDKWIYPVTDRFVTESRSLFNLELFQFAGFYHVKLENYVLKIYDYNVGKKKSIFQILITDDEYISMNTYLRGFKDAIDDYSGLL